MDSPSAQPVPQDPPQQRRSAPQRRVAITAACLGLVVVVAVVDYLTGVDLSVSLLYLVPVCWCSWSAGRRAGVLVAAASAEAWLTAVLLDGAPIQHPWVLVCNTLTLGGIFTLVATLMATLQGTQAVLEAKVVTRTAKLGREVAERRWAEAQLRQAHAELQRTQMQLIEAAKMEAVGRLAAGVAHEVKNPLMTLGMGTDYFLQRRASSSDEATLLQDMKDAVHRATGIIDLMLDFSKPRPLRLAPEDLNAIAESALGLLRLQLLKQHIEVRRLLDPALPQLPLDRTRIEHVLVNLFTNAVQAMPEGGTLTVRSAFQQAAGTDDSPAVILEVEDSGPGIPHEHLPKVFEPFYTTKPPGQGTGLGLAIVHRILQIHGGSIALGNRPDGGARATLTFNLHPHPPPP